MSESLITCVLLSHITIDWQTCWRWAKGLTVQKEHHLSVACQVMFVMRNLPLSSSPLSLSISSWQLRVWTKKQEGACFGWNSIFGRSSHALLHLKMCCCSSEKMYCFFSGCGSLRPVFLISALLLLDFTASSSCSPILLLPPLSLPSGCGIISVHVVMRRERKKTEGKFGRIERAHVYPINI